MKEKTKTSKTIFNQSKWFKNQSVLNLHPYVCRVALGVDGGALWEVFAELAGLPQSNAEFNLALYSGRPLVRLEELARM